MALSSGVCGSLDSRCRMRYRRTPRAGARHDRSAGIRRKFISGRRPSSMTPATTPATATRDESNDQEQHDGADGGVDDQSDGSNTEMDVQSRQQPIADERPDDTDDQI